jgi:hypothetical protein
MNNSEKIIKFGLVALLLLCLLDMPYGFYQIVRFIAFIGFGFLALQSNERAEKAQIIIYVSLALLFQPFFKIALGREIWKIVDFIVGIGLLMSFFKTKMKSQKIKATKFRSRSSVQ